MTAPDGLSRRGDVGEDRAAVQRGHWPAAGGADRALSSLSCDSRGRRATIPGSRWAGSTDFRRARRAWLPIETRPRNPSDGETANIPCWVRHVEGEKFQVFAINCAHLGCPVRWFPQSGLFMCPCHGGVYYSDGSRASGPPERGLFEYRYKVEQGNLLIQAGRDAHHRRSHGAPYQHLSEEIAMRLIKEVGDWFEARLQLSKPIRETMEHPVPRQTASWAYVFGSAALTVFVLQIVTGILLALLYVPSAGEAWNSLQVLNHQVTLGWFIRALHGWGSNFMIAIVLIHMIQVFLMGAYKFPRELTWIVGIFLLLFTLGMAFTGQVLRFDQDAYWGLGHRSFHFQPHTGAGAMDCEPFVGRPDHRRRYAFALLRLACVRDPGIADRIRRRASAAGAQARN